MNPIRKLWRWMRREEVLRAERLRAYNAEQDAKRAHEVCEKYRLERDAAWEREREAKGKLSEHVAMWLLSGQAPKEWQAVITRRHIPANAFVVMTPPKFVEAGLGYVEARREQELFVSTNYVLKLGLCEQDDPEVVIGIIVAWMIKTQLQDAVGKEFNRLQLREEKRR